MSGDPGGRLGDLDEVLEAQDYPITTDELETYGDYEIETQGGTESLEEVLAQPRIKRTTPLTTFEAGYWD